MAWNFFYGLEYLLGPEEQLWFDGWSKNRKNWWQKNISEDSQTFQLWGWHQPQVIPKSSRQEVFLRKGVLKICSKFTGEHPCRSVISIKLLCNFMEITLRHGCSVVNWLHIFWEHLFLKTPLDGCFWIKLLSCSDSRNDLWS